MIAQVSLQNTRVMGMSELVITKNVVDQGRGSWSGGFIDEGEKEVGVEELKEFSSGNMALGL